MNLLDLYIKDKETYLKYKKIVDECFYTKNELPNQVFKKDYSNFLFEEDYLTMCPEFWNIIKKIAEKTNDDTLILGVLDPDPITYYYKNFGYFNWVELSIDIDEAYYEDIFDIHPEGYEVDCIRHYSVTIAIVPTSKKWAIWVDRDFEICIIGFNNNTLSNEEIIELTSILNKWKNVDEAFEWFIEDIIFDRSKLQDIKELYKENYSR